MKKIINFIASFLFLNLLAEAQCSPTVIFKEDFGTGTAGFGPPLATTITAYTYNATGSLADGEYSIRKTAAPLNGNSIYPTWFTGYDHTGNGGYMMVINASYAAGKFYETRIDNLCSGTSIKFSAWIANLLKAGVSDPLDPDVKFEIKSALTGVVLGTYATGKINRYSSFTWEQYGFDILLPPGESSVVLTMYNNQVGGQGNDLVLDDIEFSVCGAETKPYLTGTYQNTNTACSGNAVTFWGNVTKQVYSLPTYQWQSSTDSISWSNISGAIQPNYTITTSSTADSKWYRLLIAEPDNINSPNCRTVSPVLRLNVYDPQPVSILHKNLYCEADSISLTSQPNALLYNWTGPNGFTSTDKTVIIQPASLMDAGTYSLQIVTNGGCVSNGSAIVTITPNNLSVNLPDTTTILCDGASITFTANNPYITHWQWNTGAQTPAITVSQSGMYTVLVADAACKAMDTTFVKTSQTPVVNLGKDTTLCYGEALVLNATNPVANDYWWQDGNTNPVRTITTSGYYSVFLANECGVAGDSILITIDENCANQLFVPTAFTPNNDGKNDVLRVRAYFPVTDFIFSIYNRWGQQVFYTTNLNEGWDGTLNGREAPVGIYVWSLQYKRKNIPYQQKGSSTLIR